MRTVVSNAASPRHLDWRAAFTTQTYQPYRQSFCEDAEIICRGRAQCKGADTWPCALCFCINVGDSWLVDEILPKLQQSYRDSQGDRR
jgi:hypothetical protein